MLAQVSGRWTQHWFSCSIFFLSWKLQPANCNASRDAMLFDITQRKSKNTSEFQSLLLDDGTKNDPTKFLLVLLKRYVGMRACNIEVILHEMSYLPQNVWFNAPFVYRRGGNLKCFAWKWENGEGGSSTVWCVLEKGLAWGFFHHPRQSSLDC